MNVVVLIPALNPDEKLIDYVKQLADYGFPRILVVNDGSAASYDEIFSRCATLEACTVLRHDVNCGKGRALKTGMCYYRETLSGFDGIITGDADGQHALADTAKLAALVSEQPDSLILGTRDFDEPHVPRRSRLGNKITSSVFRLFYGGQKLGDTQTGLRGIPNALIPWLLETDGERFEYEMNMLVESRLRKVPILESSIQTIYIDENSSSHFHPVRDSFRVYWLLIGRFIRYMFSGLVSYLLDILLYTLLVKSKILDGVFFGVLIATASARVVSSVCNYILNKKIVFHKHGGFWRSFIRYGVSVVFVLLCSAGLVSLFGSLFSLNPSETVLIKLCVDALLSIVSYALQKKWVFQKK